MKEPFLQNKVASRKTSEAQQEVIINDNIQNDQKSEDNSSETSSENDNKDGRVRNKSLIETQIYALDKLNAKYKTKTVEVNI